MAQHKKMNIEEPSKPGTSPRKVKIVVIAGPTASGKSDLAISLAKRFNGEVISADSRQVYRGMDIGTGKVPRDTSSKFQVPSFKRSLTYNLELRTYHSSGIRHWMLDVASPTRQYTAAQWRVGAERAIADIISRGKVPIICGGTGFYIDSLIYQTHFPAVRPDAKLRARLEKKSTTQLFEELTKQDPRRAKDIDPHNRRRLIRALEIILKTGKPVPSQKPSAKSQEYDVLYMGVEIPRDTLKERIERRLDERLEDGMVTEVHRLHDEGISWKRLESFGLEYRWVAQYLQGTLKSEIRIPKSEMQKREKQLMRDGLLRDIIAYARRQMTWFKRDSNIVWVKTENEASRLVRPFLNK